KYTQKRLVRTTEDVRGNPAQKAKRLVAMGFLIFCGAIPIIVTSTDHRVTHALSTIITLMPLIVVSVIVFLIGLIIHVKYKTEGLHLQVLDTNEHELVLGSALSRHDRGGMTRLSWPKLEEVELLTRGSERILRLTTGSAIYEVLESNAFAWLTCEELFLSIRTNAPQATFLVSRLDVHMTDNNSRFTKIWLDGLASDQTREIQSILQDGTKLQDQRYEILAKLGGGGQGTAYLARQSIDSDSSQDTKVVLKEYILPSHSAAFLEQDRADSLFKEGSLLSRIDNDHIVKYLDCFVEDHRGYIVLEYIEGVSLRDHIASSGPASPQEVISWSLQSLDILDYLHNLSPPVIHRDLAPDNLILTPQGKIKLVDFTLAGQLESERTAAIAGKQAYMAYEQFLGRPSTQSDIYSLGATMFYLLTGLDPEPLAASHPAEILSGLDSRLDELIARSTNTNLIQRYQNARTMKEVLLQIN
ncbi:MAG: serine/threonine protein kinase, partial [Candidatus Obscuribacterales bacterium]|nr:serine/threonine protein kinase [Candidatus Obscuribacterales bacterium]